MVLAGLLLYVYNSTLWFFYFNITYCNSWVQYIGENLSVMSVGLLLASPDDAVIWRGPKKNGNLD